MNKNHTFTASAYKFVVCMLLSLLTWNYSGAQTTVTIGSGTISNSFLPIYTCYGYNYSQQIYTASEVSSGGGFAGNITKVRFFYVSGGTAFSLWNNWTVYLGNTGLNNFANTSAWVPVGSMSQVFNGVIPTPVSGTWLELNLSTPFNYTGGNLVVAIDENVASYSCTASWRSFTATAAAGPRSLLYYSDFTNPNPAAPPTANYSTTTTRAQIQLVVNSSTPCAGTPAPGNTFAAPAAICSGTSTTLSLQNTTPGSGVSYQWQSGPSSTGPWNNFGTSLSNISVSPVSSTWYRCNVTCSASTGISTPVQVTINPFYNCYCTSAATSTADEEIFNVSFGTLNNSSVCGTTAPGPGSVAYMYSNYKGFTTIPTVSQQQVVPWSIQLGYCGTYAYSNTAAIYIDYNQNGSFADANELIYTKPYGTTALGSGTVYSGTTTIPLSALTGQTAMRVVYYETSAVSSCGTPSSWGETEDYLINIIASNNCSGTPNPGNTLASANPACVGQSFTLSLANTPSSLGNTYQWQTSLNNVSWTNVPAAGVCNYTFKLTDSYGDGWNGATMQVRQGTTVIATLGATFTTGILLNVPVALSSGVAYNLFYVGSGSYPSEVGIQILNESNSPIYTLGAGVGSAGTTLFSWTTNVGCPVPSMGPTYTTSQTVPTWYRAIVACTYSGLSATSNSILVNNMLCYCTSNATTTADEEIFNVSLGSLNNNSTCATVAPGSGSLQNRYSNYRGFATIPNLTQGTSYPVSVTVGECGSYVYSGSSAVFIDFNQDGTFDAAERVFNSAYLPQAIGGTVSSGTIMIPNCALPGSTTMRVVYAEGATAPSACGTYGYGETEDYTVNIQAVPVVAPVATSISGPATGTCNTNLAYSVAAGYFNSIQWQYASTSGGPFTDIANATSASQSLFASGPATFYLRTRFIGAGCVADAYSNEIQTVISSPVVTITTSTPSASICRGTPVTLTANGAGPFAWSSGQSTQAITVTPLINTTYTVVTGSGLCTGLGSVAIDITGGPIAQASVNPIAAQCPGEMINLNANLINTYTGPAYTGSSISYTTVSNAGTAVSFGDDVLSGAVPLGFSFSFFGVSYSQAYISSNGYLSFDAGAGAGCCSGQFLPNSSIPNNLIALAWEDFNNTGNTITYNTIGSAPNRKFVVSYTNVAHYLGGGGPLTGQIVLNENSNVIELYIASMISDGGTHTQGIENAAGNVAFTKPGLNATSWSATNSGYKFTPNLPVTFNYSGPVTYSWVGSNGFTSSAVNAIDYPEAPTTYTLTVADNICSSSSTTSALVHAAPSVTTFTGSPFCENSDVNFYTDGSGFGGSGTYGSLTINVSGTANLDETTWQLRNAANIIIANGGPYLFGSSNSINYTPAASDYPVTFTIETIGGFNDNVANYSVVCNANSSTLISGIAQGGYTFTSSPVACGGPSGFQYNWTGPNGFTSTVEDPYIYGAQLVNNGDYSVVITDGHGCTESYTTNVIINDNPEPYVASVNPVSCNGFNDGSFQIGVNGGSPFFTFFEANAGSNYSGTFSNLYDGTYYIDVTDLNQCASVSPLAITVNTTPNIAPVITCPSNITVTNDLGSCGALVNYATPVGTDVCPVAGTIQQAGMSSGVVFPVGTTLNTYQVTDVGGLTATCSFSVTVIDNLAPVFASAASALIVECDGAGNTAALNNWLSNHGNAIATDECGGLTWINNFTSLSDLCGQTGTATVNFTVTDVNGNASTTTATFTIVDTTAPIITAASNSTVQCDGSGNISALNTWIANHGGATASDACSGVTWSDNFTSLSDLCGATGSATVIFTATDACGNATSTSATFTIIDTTAPSLSCPANITVNNATGLCGNNVTYAATASDVCSGSAAITYDIAPGSFFNKGTTTVNVTATDACGNTSNCSFTVTVLDAQFPVITCASNINSSNDFGMCGAMKTYSVTYSDNCSGATLAQTAGLPSGSVFPVGTTVNTFKVTDASGNMSTCSFSVTISDTQFPTITNCPANFSSCNPISWTPPIITDNCLGLQITSTHIPGTNFPAGTTTIVYKGVDAYNNVSTCSFDVTRLEQSVAATGISSNRSFDNICLGDNITLTLNGGSLGAAASWKWYSASCGGTAIAGTNGLTSITVAPTVTTTYYVRAEGQCNITACASITIVVSTTAPNGVVITSAPAYGAVGVTGVVTATPVAGATFYRWTSNLGHINAIWFNGSVGPVETASNSVNVSFQLALQNYQIRVVAGNACGRSNNASAHIRGTVPASTCLNGPVLACPLTTATYSVAACTIPGTNSYQWSVTGNASITAGQGTPTITVAFGAGFTSSQVCVNGVTNFGLAGPQTCLTVSNNTSAPGAISGNSQPCASSTQSYSILPVVNATSYIWSTTITGATVSGTSTTGTVQFPAGPFTGQVCVRAVSSCGTSASTCFNVTSGTAGIPGPISGPVAGICGASNVNYALSTNNANSYNWVLPAGITVVSGGNSNSVNVTFASGLTGPQTITVISFYGCGSATSSIIVNGAPAIPTITPATICAGDDEQYYATSAGADSYNWTTTGADYEECTNGTACSQYYVIWGASGGTLSVTATNSCGTSASFNISTNCRLSNNGAVETKVYPNPTDGKLTIEFSSYAGGNYSLTVTDVAGRSVLVDDIKAVSGLNQYNIDLGNANAGMYMLYLKNANGDISVTKVTKE